MMRSHMGSSNARGAGTADRFFVFGKESSCVGTRSYLKWYEVVPQEAVEPIGQATSPATREKAP
jgi:hypothetical protein